MNRVLHVSTLFYANYRSEQLPGLDYLHLFAVSYSTKLITYVVSGNFYFIFHATIYFWWMTASFDNLLWTHIFQWVGSMFLDPGRVLKDYFIDRELRYSRLAWLHLPNEDPFLVQILRILKFVKPSEVWLKCFTSRIPHFREQMFFTRLCVSVGTTQTLPDSSTDSTLIGIE